MIVPELPDICVYLEALAERVAGRVLARIRLNSPFLLRSVEPPLASVEGKRVKELQRLGKRICIGVEEELWLVVHLMVAGRLHWQGGGARQAGRRTLAAFEFENGTLTLTEAGSKKRASLIVVRGLKALRSMDPGGIEVLGCGVEEFVRALRRENHTLKRALTDPRLFSGIGNAYSDEILHAARLSPLAMTRKLAGEEAGRLYGAAQRILQSWIDRLRAERNGGFPEAVTAFREGMAVHGRYGKPCPVCGAAVQRIRYADNETNYCAKCQTGGRLLADRAMSRLLREDWPLRLEETE